MPLYEFECTACAHVFERVMKVNEDMGSLACPACGVLNPKKIIGRTCFHSRERFQERLGRRMAARTAESKEAGNR